MPNKERRMEINGPDVLRHMAYIDLIADFAKNGQVLVVLVAACRLDPSASNLN